MTTDRDDKFGLLGDKMKVAFHDSSDEALLGDFNASILPTEFGGTMGPLSKVSEECIKELEDFIPTLQASNHYFKRIDTVPFPDS
ncbi:hypothetical protein AVEN_15210-1 [Araneus ventricosus]|uniref:CRAL-TRIO domain-containing protein n=1 Tax=Araneus ventricosus TaxID=182803 RepID=A0A4Y2LZU8_ARAVE|nr:hypothetical protein AVEN_15210-1 [Araneus ventricosus]